MATELTLQYESQISSPNFESADSDGNFASNATGTTVFYFQNASGSSIVVSIAYVNNCSFGYSHDDTEITIEAATTLKTPMFTIARYNDGNSNVNCTYSSVVGLSVAAVFQEWL